MSEQKRMANDSHNLQSLVNAKAALDLGLVNEDDYSRVKESFLKAQQLRSAIDAGLLEEGDQIETAWKGYVSMVLGTPSEPVTSVPVVKKALPVPPPAPAPPPPPMMQAAPPAPSQKKAPPPVAPPPLKPIPKLSGAAKASANGKSMSGISLNADAVEVFYLVRSKSKYRWVIWRINDDSTEVVIEKLGDPSSTYNDFLRELPQEDCRYAVYDYDFVGPDGQNHSKIVFINWAPDVAKVKSKMMYASTKDFFKSNLEGLSVEFQGSDFEEISNEEIGSAVKALKKNY